jgi:HTH DNA binding domain
MRGPRGEVRAPRRQNLKRSSILNLGLAGLQRAETAEASLARTARSQLPRALDHVLRTPVVTARGLADHLAISPQAALGLLRQLTAAGVVREATGRAAWRAFSTV